MWGRLAAAVTDLLLGSQQLSVRSTRKAASHSTSTSCQLTYSAIQAVLQRVGQLLPAAAASWAGQQAKPISVHIAKPVSKAGLGRGQATGPTAASYDQTISQALHPGPHRPKAC